MLEFKNARTIRASNPHDERGWHYLISYDYAAGRKDRYTLIKLTEGGAEVLGQEITLGHCKRIVREEMDRPL